MEFSPRPQHFPQTFMISGNSQHLVGATKQHQRRESFGKKGHTRGIIMGDNSSEYCYKFKDSVPTRLFK